jgi:peptidoglycan/LPS O-acetylase OafA/YrhL
LRAGGVRAVPALPAQFEGIRQCGLEGVLNTVTESRNLDILRAAAVLFVYFAHLRQFVAPMPFQLYQLGRFGVLIFFLHTCLVLLYSLQRSSYQPGLTTLNFYVRRLFRIYPLAIVTIALVLVWKVPAAPNLTYRPFELKQILSNVALIPNLNGAPTTLLVMWSLPWEIDMYLVLPMLFFMLGRRSVRTGLALWFTVVVVNAVFHVGMLTYVPYFLSGLIAFQLMQSPRRFTLPARAWPLILVLVTGLYALVWRSRPPIPLLGANLCSLLLGLCIPMLLEPRKSLFTRASHWIARYSYGIYLAHTPVMWFAFVKLAPISLVLRIAILILMSVGVPIALYHALEAPLIRLGIRLSQSLCRSFLNPDRAAATESVANVVL